MTDLDFERASLEPVDVLAVELRALRERQARLERELSAELERAHAARRRPRGSVEGSGR